MLAHPNIHVNFNRVNTFFEEIVGAIFFELYIIIMEIHLFRNFVLVKQQKGVIVRTRKDPSIRQDVFIKAAIELFKEKGYDAVSVREVLAAVGDKSASPSVFYYYFPSKDALYHACIETIAGQYVENFRKEFTKKHATLEEWALSHIDYMNNYLKEYLANEKNIMMTGKSEMNRLFILDMREKVTQQVADLWEDSFTAMGLFSQTEAKKLSQFLAGGISKMIYNYMLEEKKNGESSDELIRDIIRFSANTLDTSDEQKKMIMNAIV